MIYPLNNKIIFQFLSDVDGNTTLFKEKTDSGIIVMSDTDKSSKAPRWGKIVALGKDVCAEITKDTYILVEPMMWTERIEHDGMSLWQTDDEKILAVTDEEPKQGF